MSGQVVDLSSQASNNEVVWKRISSEDRSGDGEGVRQTAKDDAGGVNSIAHSKRDYLLRKTNELITIIEKTKLLKAKPEFRTQLYEFRNTASIIGLVVGYENSFLISPAASLENMLNSYGFVRSDLSEKEFNIILAYFSLIFTFVRSEILQKIK